jgi:hypothetical protein
MMQRVLNALDQLSKHLFEIEARLDQLDALVRETRIMRLEIARSEDSESEENSQASGE